MIYEFNGEVPGQPNGALVFDPAGNLYGGTFATTVTASSVVFELSPPAGGGTPWTAKTLVTLAKVEGGTGLQGGLIRDRKGVLYGAVGFTASSPHGYISRSLLRTDGRKRRRMRWEIVASREKDDCASLQLGAKDVILRGSRIRGAKFTRRRHFRGDPLAEFRLGDGELVRRLQIEPETRAIAEIARRRIAVSGETPRLPFRMSVTRPEGVRSAMASAPRFRPSGFRRMNRSHRRAPSVIIDNFAISALIALAVSCEGAAPSLRVAKRRGNPGDRRGATAGSSRARCAPWPLDRRVAAARLLAMTALRPLGKQLTL